MSEASFFTLSPGFTSTSNHRHGKGSLKSADVGDLLTFNGRQRVFSFFFQRQGCVLLLALLRLVLL